jgi:hypothetical protein
MPGAEPVPLAEGHIVVITGGRPSEKKSFERCDARLGTCPCLLGGSLLLPNASNLLRGAKILASVGVSSGERDDSLKLSNFSPIPSD